MNKVACVNNEGRKYGLWSIDKENNKAVRKCLCCGIDFYYPIDDDKNNNWILEEIRKQDEASKLLDEFKIFDINSPNLVYALNVILEKNVCDRIDTQKKKQLTDKFKEIVASDSISFENMVMIKKFILAIKSNNNDLYFETYEEFKELNYNNLYDFVSSSKPRR